jgi:hypothetical protein
MEVGLDSGLVPKWMILAFLCLHYWGEVQWQVERVRLGMSEKTLNPMQFVSFSVLWMISGALSVLDWLTLRSAITNVVVVIANAVPIESQIKNQWYLRWTVPAVDKFVLVILGLCAFLSICILDYYYQAGLLKGVIQKRFGLATAIQVGILVISGVITWITASIV